jgi:hypothetical protein
LVIAHGTSAAQHDAFLGLMGMEIFGLNDGAATDAVGFTWLELVFWFALDSTL